MYSPVLATVAEVTGSVWVPASGPVTRPSVPSSAVSAEQLLHEGVHGLAARRRQVVDRQIAQHFVQRAGEGKARGFDTGGHARLLNRP
jgi:hypothetical protein